MPKLTIITITYNAERFLERTILSITEANQNFDIEYLVIDGSSKDGTVSIIEKYDKHISRYWRVCVVFERWRRNTRWAGIESSF
jgi:glycosyltransferase involved in cell wall biosynthesis